ncbi:glycosyltransferase family 2 protein [Burkholderia sp. Bp9126]|nr:glycosyltransferase family 2 protein [Burkholderia sp. Bp9126]
MKSIYFNMLLDRPWGGAFLVLFGMLLTVQIMLVAWLCLRLVCRPRNGSTWSRTPLSGDINHPLVSIIVPAFNEEKVIAATVDSLLTNDYTNMEIIVIDDGSQDDTRNIVNSIANVNAHVKLISLPHNSGKAHALNTGIAAANSDYIVSVDADTIVAPDFVRRIVAPLVCAEADAVAGNIKVGNRRCIKAKFQSLEYICSLNTTRTLQDACRAITTLPGAGSAFRKSAVVAVGGFTSNTRAEDTELTLKLAQWNFRAVYQPEAVAYTEAPVTWRGLFRQRWRWIYGNMQCAGLHLKNIKGFNGMSALWFPLFVFDNFIKIPIWFAFVAFPFAFIADAIFLKLLHYYCACISMNCIIAALTYCHERERKLEILYLPIKWCVWPAFSLFPYAAAIWHYLGHRPIGWQKLERTAEVACVVAAPSASADARYPSGPRNRENILSGLDLDN